MFKNLKIVAKAAAVVVGGVVLIKGCSMIKEGGELIVQDVKGFFGQNNTSLSQEDEVKVEKIEEAVKEATTYFNETVLESIKNNSNGNVDVEALRTDENEMLSVLINNNPAIQRWLGTLTDEEQDGLFAGYDVDPDKVADDTENVQRKLWAVYMYSTVPSGIDQLFLDAEDQEYYQAVENAFIKYNEAYFDGREASLSRINTTIKTAIDTAEEVTPAAAGFTLDPAMQVYDVAFRNDAARITDYVVAGKAANDKATGSARVTLYALLAKEELDVDCDPGKTNPNTGAMSEEEWEEYKALHMVR